jgi:hypothetical protein
MPIIIDQFEFDAFDDKRSIADGGTDGQRHYPQRD